MLKYISRLVVIAVVLLSAVDAYAQVRVRGYYRKDGTYVRPHYRSSPDGNFWNNWSTIGNINPYTGKYGTLRTPPSRYGLSYSGSRYSSAAGGAYSSRSTASSWDDESGKLSADVSERPRRRASVPTKVYTDEELAVSKLSCAKQLVALDRPDKGRKWLIELIELYPLTEAAAEAAELLESLRDDATEESVD